MFTSLLVLLFIIYNFRECSMNLTKRAQNMFELGVQHGAVSFLVVKLQYFHEVLVGAAVLVLLNLRVNGQEFIELHLLGLLLLLHSELKWYYVHACY